ncbi:MAG TPA: EscU/YscU/HrcU family type III secretion system export apparatus switch protein [Geothrix sp.]|nr:EscU/YscU/HrcU family type III secretion system export apparatus switch protein [Geothrix sp.]
MSQQDLDKNLAATPYKLEKAKERGEVSKSPDVVAAVVFTAAMVFLTWQGWTLCREQFRFDQMLLGQAVRVEANPAVVWPLIQHTMRSTFLLLIPFFATLMLAGILSNILQTGPVFSVEPVKPKWERINPAEGVKRVFSMRTLFAGIRALLKLLLLGTVVYFALKAMVPRFYHLADLSPLGLVRTLLDSFASLGLKLALMLGLIALLDMLYTRYEFAKKMRMSHREMKDEHKHREGDPRIRGRLRQLRKEVLKRSRALRRTSEADVLITNPTHVAVALRYKHGQMASPQLIAKGKGFMAAAMRQIAARHSIPVVQNPALARALYRELGVDHHVPPDLYAQVARIIVWVFAMRDRRNARPGGAPALESN